MVEHATLERMDTRAPVHTSSLELDAKHVNFNTNDDVIWLYFPQNSGICMHEQSWRFETDFIQASDYYKLDFMVAGQNGSGQNGTDKMVWTKC